MSNGVAVANPTQIKVVVTGSIQVVSNSPNVVIVKGNQPAGR